VNPFSFGLSVTNWIISEHVFLHWFQIEILLCKSENFNSIMSSKKSDRPKSAEEEIKVWSAGPTSPGLLAFLFQRLASDDNMDGWGTSSLIKVPSIIRVLVLVEMDHILWDEQIIMQDVSTASVWDDVEFDQRLEMLFLMCPQSSICVPFTIM